MPPGAKKRKALKKKQQQEAIGTSNGDNLHEEETISGGNGRQDDRESDSNLSSPGSQGNHEQFGENKDPSTAKEISEEAVTQGLGGGGPESGNNGTALEIGGTDVVVKSNVSCYENTTQHPCDKEIAPVAETSKLAVEKSGETKENGKVEATLVESANGTTRKVESAEVPPPSEEKCAAEEQELDKGGRTHMAAKSQKTIEKT